MNITKSDLERLSYIVTDAQKREICENLGVSIHTLYSFIAGKRKKPHTALLRALIACANENIISFQSTLKRLEKVTRVGTNESKEKKQLDIKEVIATTKKEAKKRTKLSKIEKQPSEPQTKPKPTKLSKKNEAYKDAVLLIIKLRKRELSYKKIVEKLNERGLKNSRGENFNVDSVKKIYLRSKAR